MYAVGHNLFWCEGKNMKTPYGKECAWYYADFHRSHEREECRLVKSGSLWHRELCRNCEAPAIAAANNCENLDLIAEVQRSFFGKKTKGIIIKAFCRKSNDWVQNPYIGCGQCHPIPDVFKNLF